MDYIIRYVIKFSNIKKKKKKIFQRVCQNSKAIFGIMSERAIRHTYVNRHSFGSKWGDQLFNIIFEFFGSDGYIDFLNLLTPVAHSAKFLQTYIYFYYNLICLSLACIEIFLESIIVRLRLLYFITVWPITLTPSWI